MHTVVSLPDVEISTPLPELSEGGLGGITLQNAMVFPVVKHPELPGRYFGGISDPVGDIHEFSLLNRDWGKIVFPGSADLYTNLPTKKLKGRHIFGGYVFLHFGHFLLESLSRIWALNPDENDTIVWVHIQRFKQFTDCQLEILALWGLDKCHHVMTNDLLEVEELVVPEPGYRIQNLANPRHLNKLGVIKTPEVIPGKMLWLSRSRQEGKGRWVNELEIEKRLVEEGWSVYFPEDHSITEQIHEIATSERVAGSEGSAFHTIILGDHFDCRFDLFSRGHNFNGNYATIGLEKKLRQYLHVSPVRLLSRVGAVSEMEVFDIDHILSTLRIPDTELTANCQLELPELLKLKAKQQIGRLPMSETTVVAITPKSKETPQRKPSLDACGIANNTDKASVFVTENKEKKTGHNYLHSYELLLERFRDKTFTLMELGIGPEWNSGASLRMWRDYFENASIVGVDIRKSAVSEVADRIEVNIGDLGDVRFLRTLSKHKATIIVDDASHRWNHQILALCDLYPTLPSGGMYIVEDINTSFQPMASQYGEEGALSAYEFLQGIADKVTSYFKFDEHKSAYTEYQRYIAKNTSSICFSHGSCMLVKK